MNTGLWNMDSGLATARRPGMTNLCLGRRGHRPAGVKPTGRFTGPARLRHTCANNAKRRKAMEEYAMSERTLIPISAQPRIGKIDEAEYFRLYEQSLADPDGFWGEQGKRLDWIKPYTKVCNASFTGDVSIRWYEDGTLNASATCIDRHLAQRCDHI